MIIKGNPHAVFNMTRAIHLIYNTESDLKGAELTDQTPPRSRPWSSQDSSTSTTTTNFRPWRARIRTYLRYLAVILLNLIAVLNNALGLLDGHDCWRHGYSAFTIRIPMSLSHGKARTIVNGLLSNLSQLRDLGEDRIQVLWRHRSTVTWSASPISTAWTHFCHIFTVFRYLSHIVRVHLFVFDINVCS